MDAEFPYPPNFYATPSIETWHSPYRDEELHRLILSQSTRQFQEAQDTIYTVWKKLLIKGLDEALVASEVSGKMYKVTFYDGDENKSSYFIRYNGTKLDALGQQVSVFQLVKDGQQPTAQASLITVALAKDAVTHHEQLVALVFENEDISLAKHQFHFHKGRLDSIQQISQPQILFTSPNKEEKQFLAIARGSIEDGTLVLRVEAGHMYEDDRQCHWYQNLGGNLVRSQRLRVHDGQLELFDLTKAGIIDIYPAIDLPRAINNIANFKPATSL